MPAESLRAAPTPNFWPAEAPTRGCGKCTGPPAVTEQTTNAAAVASGLPTHHPQRSPPHSCRQRQARMAERATPIRAAVATTHPTHHVYGHRPRCYQKHPTDNQRGSSTVPQPATSVARLGLLLECPLLQQRLHVREQVVRRTRRNSRRLDIRLFAV